MREQVREVLELPLGELVMLAGPDAAGLKREAHEDQWAVPDGDRDALERWGVPRRAGYSLVSDTSQSAILREDQDGRQYYRLGEWMDFEVVAYSPSGEVWGKPLTSWHSDEYLINSTLAGYVDATWRYHYLYPIFTSEESNDYFSCVLEFFDRIAECDPRVREYRHSLWHYVLLTV